MWNLWQIQFFLLGCGPIKGLKGWIFEQVIQKCIREELSLRGISFNITEEYKLEKIIKVDLKIDDKILIEIKRSGFYSNNDGEKYKKYFLKYLK